MRKFAEERGETMEDVFYSAYSSLQLQLRGKYFLLNCSSGFARLIMELVKGGGCGFARDPIFICLQEQVSENEGFF